MKKTEIPRKPSRLIYILARIIIMPFVKIRYNVHFNKTKIRNKNESFIMLANHAHSIDTFILGYSVYPKVMNFVGGYSYAQHWFLKYFIKLLGVLPKFQYQIDFAGVKQMLSLLKNGQNLALFPSGRLSSYGNNEIVTPAIAKLIKIAKVDVYFTEIAGTYFTRPKWAKFARRGRVEATTTLLLKKEEIEKLSNDEINTIIQEKLNYNEYRWQKEKMIPFKGKNFAENVQNVLYKCPICGKEYCIETKGNDVFCTECGKRWIINEYGFFEGENEITNPYDWSLYLKEDAKRIVEEERVDFEEKVTLKILRKGKAKYVGEGVVKLTNEGMYFDGIFEGEQTHMEFTKESLISLPFTAGSNFEMMYKTHIIKFYVEHVKVLPKWSLIVEELAKK